MMWGFWEGANWIPQSSLYKRDWTPLPAAKTVAKQLVRQRTALGLSQKEAATAIGVDPHMRNRAEFSFRIWPYFLERRFRPITTSLGLRDESGVCTSG